MKYLAGLMLFIITIFEGLAQTPKLMLPVGHTHPITQIVFSPDGRLIATGSEDKTIKLWDVNTGRLLANLKGHMGEITSLSFNAAGDRILSTASLDTNAFLWNAHSGAPVAALHSSAFIDQAFFSPDGKLVFKQTSGEKPVLYSAQTGAPLIELKTFERYIGVAAFSPDSKKLLSKDGEVWDTQTGALLFTLQGAKSAQFVFFNPNGRQIVTVSLGKIIKLWDASSGTLQYELKGHTDYLKQFCFSPDGKRLVTASGHTTVAKLWDLEKGGFVADLTGNDNYLLQIAFSADSKTIVTNGNSQTKIWEAATGTLKSEGVLRNSFIKTHPQKAYALVQKEGDAYTAYGSYITPVHKFQGMLGVQDAAFHPVEDKIAAKKDNAQTVAIWHAGTGNKLVELSGSSNEIRNAYLNPQRNFLLTEGYKNVRFWSVNNSLLQAAAAPAYKDVKLARYSPDGKVLAMLSEEGSKDVTSLWNAATLSRIPSEIERASNVGTEEDLGFLFFADSKKLYIADKDWGGSVVDATTGKLLKKINHKPSWFSITNADATRYATYSEKGVEIKDVESETTLTSFPCSATGYRPIEFTGHQNRFLLFDVAGVSLFDENGKKPILLFPNGVYRFNRERNKLLVRTLDTIRVWDLAKAGLQLQVLPPPNELSYENLWDAVWAPDEKSIYYSTNQGNIRRVDLATGKQTPVSPGVPKEAGYAKTLSFSKDGNLLFALNDEVVTIFNLKTMSVKGVLRGHENPVVSVMELPDTTRLLTVGKDNTGRVWDLSTGKLLYTYLLLGHQYHFYLLPDGYYQANPAASKLLHYVDANLRPISFEQLDVRYNRPDLVLEAIGNTDTTLISSYRRAYLKRIQRLGMDTTAFGDGFGLPEADFERRNLISYEQKEGYLNLRIRGRDSAYFLDRFNVWVNESPLFGLKGFSLRNRKSNSLDTTIRVHLSAGINVLETSITNVNGTESYRMPLTVSYTPQTQLKERLYFVGIGIDRFKDPTHNLNYSVKDVRDLAIKLREKYGNEVVIDTLFNEKVTTSNVRALKKKLLATSVNDKVLLSYSGHGLLSGDYDYYLSTFDVNFQKPEAGGLPYDALESLLDSIPARKKLMCIDACHSGEVDKEEMQKIAQVTTASIPGEGAKGTTPVLLKDAKKVGMKNSFELMQELFVNVGRSTGATVISAAAGTQFALERGDLKNGVFTYSILEYMNEHPTCTVSELKQYVNKRVPELTRGLQVPTTRTEPKQVDWKVW